MFGLDTESHLKFVFDYNSIKIFMTKIKGEAFDTHQTKGKSSFSLYILKLESI